VDDGGGGFAAEDFGFGGGVEAGAEVAGRVSGGRGEGGGNGVMSGGVLEEGRGTMCGGAGVRRAWEMGTYVSM
jgi:hypothetical protein